MKLIPHITAQELYAMSTTEVKAMNAAGGFVCVGDVGHGQVTVLAETTKMAVDAVDTGSNVPSKNFMSKFNRDGASTSATSATSATKTSASKKKEAPRKPLKKEQAKSPKKAPRRPRVDIVSKGIKSIMNDNNKKLAYTAWTGTDKGPSAYNGTPVWTFKSVTKGKVTCFYVRSCAGGDRPGRCLVHIIFENDIHPPLLFGCVTYKKEGKDSKDKESAYDITSSVPQDLIEKALKGSRSEYQDTANEQLKHCLVKSITASEYFPKHLQRYTSTAEYNKLVEAEFQVTTKRKSRASTTTNTEKKARVDASSITPLEPTPPPNMSPKLKAKGQPKAAKASSSSAAKSPVKPTFIKKSKDKSSITVDTDGEEEEEEEEEDDNSLDGFIVRDGEEEEVDGESSDGDDEDEEDEEEEEEVEEDEEDDELIA